MNTEQGEIYFKDQINWKFANYLTDKSTQIEDEYGVHVLIQASVKTGRGIYRKVYSINKDKFMYFGSTVLDYLHSGGGIWYVITMMDYDGLNYKLSSKEGVLDKYLSRISSRNHIVKSNSTTEAYVQPKTNI